MRIAWTLQAVEDVEAIRDFVARDSPHAAALLAQRLVTAVEHLGRFPESGRIVPELGVTAIREVIRGDYRIVYLVGTDTVRILTVYRGSQLFPDLSMD